MRLRRLSPKGLSAIDVTPLVDVVFLLLIFFVLTSTYMVQPGIDIKLPKVTQSEAVTSRRVEILIDGRGYKYMKGYKKELTADELDRELAKIAREGTPVFIKADANARLHHVVEVWDRCKVAGIASDKLSIATEAK